MSDNQHSSTHTCTSIIPHVHIKLILRVPPKESDNKSAQLQHVSVHLYTYLCWAWNWWQLSMDDEMEDGTETERHKEFNINGAHSEYYNLINHFRVCTSHSGL